MMYDAAQSGSFSFDVDLWCDLNFSAQERKMEHPLGQNASDMSAYPYCGTFNGNGHTISGLNMSVKYGSSSDAGFFYALGNAVIRDLHFDETCAFDGVWAGALAVKIRDATDVIIINVSSAATVRSGSVAGGLICAIDETTSSRTVVFESCTNSGNVSVVTQSYQMQVSAGGLVGTSNIIDSSLTGKVSFIKCHNIGAVSVTLTRNIGVSFSASSGIIGIINVYEKSIVSFESCTNKGTIHTVVESDFFPTKPLLGTASSGISSFFFYSDSPGTVTLSKCSNSGNVTLMSHEELSYAMYASGVLTVISVVSSSNKMEIEECINTGSVFLSATHNKNVLAAGISTLNTTGTSQVQSCHNSGDITSTGTVCGIVCRAQNVYNTGNTGSLEGETVYGIAQHVSQAQNIVSIGDISGTEFYSSFMFSSRSSNVYLKEIVNVISTGVMIIKNPSTGRWIIPARGNDTTSILNEKVEQNRYKMWWTSNLTLGHRVIIHGNNLPSSVINNSVVIAEHGETLRNAITRDGLAEILDERKYATICLSCGGLDDGVESDVTITVKMKFRLMFSGLTTATIVVLDGDVPTSEELVPISKFLHNESYIIVNSSNPKMIFNPDAQVTSDANYTVKKAKSLEVIIDGPASEKDIKDALDNISGDGACVRVIEIDNSNGVTRIIIVVDEEHSRELLDDISQCKSTA